MFVVGETRNDMPMQMRHHITQSSNIGFVSLEHAQNKLFKQYNRIHTQDAIFTAQVRKLTHMVVPDQAQKPRIIGIHRLNHTELAAIENPITTRCGTQGAIGIL